LPRITYKQHDGTEHVVEVEAGTSVMQGALNNGISGVVAECGGSMACATCHVYVDDAWLDRLPETDEMESQMLDCVAAERRANSRLGCQVNVTDEISGMIVRIPETQY
jgi:2Fe-2S ferredoxin